MSDIQYTYPLIHNKVTSPHYVTPTLRRARLLEWLHGNAECRAVVIAADAGYGKTTLLWQWEREVDFPCYWYKLDRNDRDWSLHISYLIESISQRHAGFGRRAHSMLQQLGGPGSSRPGVAAFLLSEMHERLTEPCTFIIDDWQYVNSVTEVRGLWNQMLRDAPPTCRFVFASRAKPKLQFARFKTHAGYGELRTDALRFNDREIDELFREIYQDPLDPAELAELERRTEGWAASLQLVEVSLRERLTPESRRDFIYSITAGSDNDLFAFLAEEVLDQQPEETRNFLLTTSVVQQVTPELAERLAGVHDGSRELVDLEQRGLFTYRLDDARFRYHHLFREFLERRLVQERTATEIVGLHIHAASYFETTQQWPQAIHHYLRAGLQRQAARLIARYGEEVVSSGGLGLIDEWLQQLPERTVRENARLSLLSGEVLGKRGDYGDALAALDRSREYFAKKGDRRMEALACLKLSSVHTNYGAIEKAADAALQGLALAPADAVSTHLRLEGNLAITHTWMNEGLEAVVRTCKRIAVEAGTRGFDHWAAIALHNMGAAQRQIGALSESATNLERATALWSGVPTTPFADNLELVATLLALDDIERAQRLAEDAMMRTAPWPRPNSEAQVGLAMVRAHQNRLPEALEILYRLQATPTSLWALNEVVGALLVDCLFLTDAEHEAMAEVLDHVREGPRDPRHEAITAVGAALSRHRQGTCAGECLAAESILRAWDARGAHLVATVGFIKLGVLALEHARRNQIRLAVEALSRARGGQLLRYMRLWIRKYATHIDRLMAEPMGVELIEAVIQADPDGWRDAAIGTLRVQGGGNRERLLASIVRHANKQTVATLRSVAGQDVIGARRALVHQQAPRLFIRAFGPISVQRGGWTGPEARIDKKRLRTMLGLLVAYSGGSLSRDAAIDILWPDADPNSAVNSLNQTVFQLRRVLDPAYKDGESAQYITSTVDLLQLDPQLVRTDLGEFRRLAARIRSVSNAATRLEATDEAVRLVRAEFLSDLNYEDWVSAFQTAVHAEIREALLPIAHRAHPDVTADLAVRAGCVLVMLDEFDEAAHVAMALSLAESGRRAAAREGLSRFASKLRQELDEAPSAEVEDVLDRLGRKSMIS